MMRSQPELPVRAMFQSMAKEQQWLMSVSMSVAHITVREHGDVPMSLVKTATRDHVAD